MQYRTVWRWHFYASLFCMPFVIILSITGAIYLFKPQLDRFRDRAYNGVVGQGEATLPSQQIQAVLHEFPDYVPAAYELRTASTDAVRIVMQKGSDRQRVFVDPVSLTVLGSRPEEGGPVRLVRTIHGQLGMGERGSNLVELASSWTIIMILTGLFLWWPRGGRLAGVLYPRLWQGRKLFWRDIHSVTGVWISLLVLFLLMTGLPWAKFWGNYFKTVRGLTGTAVAKTDWTIGGVAPESSIKKKDEHSEHGGGGKQGGGGWRKRNGALTMPKDLTDFDRLFAIAEPMQLAYPATISPPAKASSSEFEATWTIKSDAQNRPLRVTLEVRPKSGEIVSREDYASKHWLDRAVAIGIAAHEGQLFGVANQILGVITATGLVLLCISGIVMWWRRRDKGTLGAPTATIKPNGWSLSLLLIIVALGLYLPLFGLSLIIVLVIEKLLLVRIPKLNHWLGLHGAGTQLPSSAEA